MNYYFADWEADPDGGMRPRLPPNLGYRHIASAGHESPWALWKADLVASEATLQGLERVPWELSRLLVSAEMYPPALALSRRSAEHWLGPPPTRERFAHRFGSELLHYLRLQPSDSYVVAQATKQRNMLSEGGFFWILEYHPPSGAVQWVSWQYDIYVNPASDFAISDEALAALSL